MSDAVSLSRDQLDTFERQGVLRLPGLLSAERVRAAREQVLSRLERLGLWRDGAWRLDDRPESQTPSQITKAVGNKHPQVEALLEEPALLTVVDALLGGRAFEREIYKRPQVLVTLPDAETWTLPGGWHCDSPRLASGESLGVQMFAFLDPVEARGGGTLVVAGSHRLLNEGRFLRPGEIPKRLGHEAFFRDLFAGGDGRADLPRGAAENVGLEVIELIGEPGDAYLIDLRLLHAKAPNATDRPRMMATHRFVRADLMAEMAAGFGWN